MIRILLLLSAILISAAAAADTGFVTGSDAASQIQCVSLGHDTDLDADELVTPNQHQPALRKLPPARHIQYVSPLTASPRKAYAARAPPLASFTI